MWGTILKLVPGLLINGLVPVVEFFKSKAAAKLKDIQTVIDEVDKGNLSEKEAINLIRIELAD